MEAKNIFMNVSETDSVTSYECECGYATNRKYNLKLHKRNCITGALQKTQTVSEDKDDTIETLQNENRQLKERLAKQQSKMVEYENKIIILETEVRLKEEHRIQLVTLLRATPIQQPVLQQPVLQQPAELAKAEKMTPLRFMKERCKPISIDELVTGISELTRDEMNCFAVDGHVDGHCHVIDMVIKKLDNPLTMRPFHGIINHKDSGLYIKINYTARKDLAGLYEPSETWYFDDVTVDLILLKCRVACLNNLTKYKISNPLPKRLYYDEDDPDNETDNNKAYIYQETFGGDNNNQEIHDWVDLIRQQVSNSDETSVKQIIRKLKYKYELTTTSITLNE